MKRISKYISSALMMAAIGCAFTACDDWTEPESIDLDYGTIDQVDPVAYQKYLANLREYRSLPHKKVYTWFNNAENAFGSQGHRISALPDSVDVIVLANPDKVTNQMIQEMYEARVNKGQEFSYCVNYDDIKADYIALCEELAAKRIAFSAQYPDAEIPADLQDPNLLDYIAKATTKKLSYFNAIGFDRIMAGYNGKTTNYMTPAELKEYQSVTNAFLGIIADWKSRNTEVKLDLMCIPQYADADILSVADYVFFSQSLSANNSNQYSYYLNLVGDAVDLSKCGMLASVPDNSGADPKLGYFANGQLAVIGLADWTAAHEVGCVGTYNTADDYFLTNGKYTTIRTLIHTVNPNAK